MKKTILWALNSKCLFKCRYCYLNFSEDNNPIKNIKNKESEDIIEEEAIKFISELKENGIERIFIAGAEPLSNPKKTFNIIKYIKRYNLQVILCTNGYMLDKYYEQIIDSKIDGISISLDSHNKQYNNKYRQYPTNNGWNQVVKGITLLRKKKEIEKANIKIGVYTVVTKKNIKDLEKTYEFVVGLGLDYYIFQPIYLQKNHKLFNELALDKSNVEELNYIIEKLYSKRLKTKLPNTEYIELVLKSIQEEKKEIMNCFAGENLFFITPDGNIHVCPSSNSIIQEKEKITIRDNLRKIFVENNYKVHKCNKFSEDCVNMWQLMAFDEILE